MPRFWIFGRDRPGASKFEDLMRPQVDFLYRLAWRFTGSVADAEDLVQDVLLKLFPRSAEMARIEQLRPWLARVLYRQFIDDIRRRSRSPLSAADPEPGDGEAPEPAAQDEGPEAHAERGELQSRILAALDGLGAEQRAVVVLHDVEGYSLEELEPILQAPLGTLKSRLHRARQRLRSLLEMEPFSAGQRVKR